MSGSEKDRLGERLRDKEKAEEDQYFSQRDRELLENLKQGQNVDAEARARELARMRCPKCGEPLVAVEVAAGIRGEKCPGCHGIWLDHGELERAMKYEKHTGWLTRYLERIRRPS